MAPVCAHDAREAAVEGDQQIQTLLLAHLAHQQAIGPHPQGLLDQTSQPDLTGALQVGLTGLHRDDVG